MNYNIIFKTSKVDTFNFAFVLCFTVELQSFYHHKVIIFNKINIKEIFFSITASNERISF